VPSSARFWSGSSDSGGSGAPGMEYAPENQLPRSTSRQRIEQKGKGLWLATDVNSNTVPQRGQRPCLGDGVLGSDVDTTRESISARAGRKFSVTNRATVSSGPV
jgi:hypothetical protein